MLKITIKGEPDEIAAFFFHLDDIDEIGVEYKTPISKRAEHHKWGSVLAGLHVQTVAGLESEVTIYASKHSNKSSNKSSGKSSSVVQSGYVYLLPYFGANGIEGYKIGKTENPRSRRKTFGVKFNFDISFLALIYSDNYAVLERVLHQRYAAKRRGFSEWFNLSPDDVAAIQSMMSESDKKLLQTLEGVK